MGGPPVTFAVNVASDDAALFCAHCRRVHNLFVRVGIGREVACPSARVIPAGARTMQEVQDAENRIRDAMQRRGGPDRHMVRKGRT